MTTVVIVDDHPIVRAGMRTILTNTDDITVVAEGARGADALCLVAEQRPDVLVLYVNLPAVNGIEVTRQLRAQGAQTAILILTVHHDRQTVFGLLESGATGYVLKDDALETLVSAVRAVARGGSTSSPIRRTRRTRGSTRTSPFRICAERGSSAINRSTA